MTKFYLTTPIYYVNDRPHIGHAYTTIAADVLARYHRQRGDQVFFLTGTDEHGEKIAEAAEKKGVPPQVLVDELAAAFRATWKKLNISHDDFIRTTEPRHEKVVQGIFSRLLERGDIYRGEYEGWYCISCEAYWTESQLSGKYKCPDCGREVERLKEDTYFFKLSKYEKPLLEYIARHPDFIEPATRRNEVVSFIKAGLRDLSITRTNFNWGVKVPGSDKHVIYVWFDALINYVSALGFLGEEKLFRQFWPADVHLVGKEITRFHAVIWPAMLLALGVPLPKKVFGHGWWTVEGEKMSKSKGNMVDPLALAEEFSVDTVRYFILREVPFGVDGDFSRASLIARFNADLANDLGNLLSRTLTMVEKYFAGAVPAPVPGKYNTLDKELVEAVKQTPPKVDAAMDRLQFSESLAATWQLISLANSYIEKSAPWTLAKEGQKDALASVLYNLVEVLRSVALLVAPFMPSAADNMWEQLGFSGKPGEQKVTDFKWGGTRVGLMVKKGAALFPRIVKDQR